MCQRTDMRLPRNRCCARRNAMQIVDDTRGRSAEMCHGLSARVCRIKIGADLLGRQIGDKRVKRIAFDRTFHFAAKRRSGQHAEGVEASFRAVPIRIGQSVRLEDAIVQRGMCLVADRVARKDSREIVFVIPDHRVVPEGIAV
jgi:hypothetical protein